ncbi:NIPSNAP family protein [Cyclobacterium marinum]|uniref:NIPSNAP family containing protein n=1 Tax=Cyclobacterium marinum (strain ATCC 25205 / DSM 745 / LMG 13164 / NCIMB 1802) TaxID=880070 RepID=G0IVV7_CYCMS|nr:NIPSNAP family protein [Cyclobacterium marinum]AEL25502.1 NIPSNAP family containing protein [Cyclobacterium marinum DSM 745]
MKDTITVLSSVAILLLTTAFSFAEEGDFYQIKIYHFSTSDQESVIDEYLEKAYLPAMHRAGIEHIGVFKPVASTEGNKPSEKLIYVLIPFSSQKEFSKIDSKLAKDQQFQSAGAKYLNAPYTNPPYDRIESILLNAFEKHPKYGVPDLSGPNKDRIYELRSYEGHTENISENKIKMFNDGDEVGLFKRLGFNAVFYGEVISGPTMPNLMYMTTFENKADRDAHWDAFRSDPYWKELSSLPQYQNNVSKNVTTFLYPTDYSDI